MVQRNVGTVASKLAAIFPAAKVEIEPTTGPGDATAFAKRVANEFGARALVAVAGGDGSISEAANGLIGSSTTLLALPFGSGNDLARTLYRGGTSSPHDILDAFMSEGAWVSPMDALKVSGDRVRDNRGNLFNDFHLHSINVISIGLDSKVALAADQIQRKFSWSLGMSYPAGVVKALMGERVWRMRIATDREGAEDRPYILCAIGNASYYGGGFLPHPDALLTDGLMNILTARPVSVLDVARLIGKFRRGEVIDPEVATYEQAASAHIEAVGRELILTLDGEGFYADAIDIEVVSNALSVALPISWGVPPAFRKS